MTLVLGLSLVLSVLLGVLMLDLVWPRTGAARPLSLLLALGGGFGVGLSAVLLFAWLLAFGPTHDFPVLEAGLLCLVIVASAVRQRTRSTRALPPQDQDRSRPLLLLSVVFLVTLVAAAAAFTSLMRQQPHGEWDAWMNWDLRARMLFRGGDAWRTAFSPTFPWSHPDYPLLVPSLVVRTWLYVGRETLVGPALIGATFTFGTVALLVTALGALRSTSQGLVAGVLLLSTPFFILHGTSLYADVPLGFFFLATVVCLALDGRHFPTTARFAALAGLAAGLGMWTKNEGTLFTVAVGAGLLVAGAREGWRLLQRRARWFAAGLFPMLLIVAGFKIAFAPRNDLLSTLGVERTLGRLTDPTRYLIVLREYTSHIFSFGDNGFGSVVWVLLAYLLALGLSRSEVTRPWLKASTIALVLLLAGHFMVFVSMADELSRLLASSLDRLLLQLWPSALFLFFMVVRTPEEARSDSLLIGHPVANP